METILYTIVICQSLKMCICASYYDNVIDNDFESSLSIAVDLSVGPVQHNDTNIHIVGGHRGALCDGGWWLYSVYQYSWHPSYLQISAHTRHDAVPGQHQDKISRRNSSMAIFPLDTDGVLQSGLCGPGPGERAPTSLPIQLSSG